MSAPSLSLNRFQDIYRESQQNLRELAERLPEENVASLAKEVLRNLALREPETPDPVANPSTEQIRMLCDALISDDDSAGADFILNVQAKGASPENVYLNYLAAAARMLGEWWEEDKVSFVTVARGSVRIFSIMRAMRDLFVPRERPVTKTALFAPVPGENHTIGIRMATDLFRNEGWDIDLKVGLTQDALIEQVDWSKVCIVGLSFGGEHSIDALTRLIVAIKIQAPAVEILVSGQNVDEVRKVIDGMSLVEVADDLDDALKHLNAMWDRAFIS